MPEPTTTEAPVTLTAVQVNEMITTALQGHAAKYERQLNKQTELFTQQLQTVSTTPAPVKTPDGTPAVQVDPKVAALERTVADLTKAQLAAEQKAIKAEQSAILSEALGTYSFASDRAREVAVKTFESQMARSQDGQYFIGDRAVKEAVAEQMKELPGLLAVRPVGSSGAVGTKSNVNAGLEGLIKPQMTPQEIQQAYAILRQRQG